MPADTDGRSTDVKVYDGTWFDTPDGDFAYALCNTAPWRSPPPPPQPPIRPLKSEANNMSTDDDDGSTIIVALVVVLAVVALAVALAIGVAVFVWKKKKRSEPPVGAVAIANPVAVVNGEMQNPGQGPSSAVSVEMPKAASGKKSVSLKLKELGLEQYASALIDDQGYDSMTTLQGLTKEEAGAIADEIKMKPGHKRRFVEGITK